MKNRNNIQTQSIIDEIDHKFSAIIDYLNLTDSHMSNETKNSGDVMINYSKKQYPLNKIEEWAKEGRKLIKKINK